MMNNFAWRSYCAGNNDYQSHGGGIWGGAGINDCCPQGGNMWDVIIVQVEIRAGEEQSTRTR